MQAEDYRQHRCGAGRDGGVEEAEGPGFHPAENSATVITEPVVT